MNCFYLPIVFSATVAASTVLAESSTTCYSADHKYESIVDLQSSGTGELTLFVDGQSPEFGDLSCSQDLDVPSAWTCESGTVSAGYSAIVRTNLRTVVLSENVFEGGDTTLSTLSCK